MHNLSYKINGPENFLSEKFNLDDHIPNDKDSVCLFKLNYSFLSSDLVYWFRDNLNVKPQNLNIQLFYTPPFWKNKGVHVDGFKSLEMWAINKVINGSKSGIMRWYKNKTDGHKFFTNANTSSLLYNYNEVEEIERELISDTSIVHIGIPHSIDNIDPLPRWCLSVRPYFYQTSYQNTVKLLKEKNLLC
jgi:hypothetical protein